jgi:hypothetical protein
MSETKAYRWEGVWDEGAGGWQEFFGAATGAPIPARDLTADEVAGFSDEQKAHLESPAGQRLYEPVKHPDDDDKGGKTGKSDKIAKDAKAAEKTDKPGESEK